MKHIFHICLSRTSTSHAVLSHTEAFYLEDLPEFFWEFFLSISSAQQEHQQACGVYFLWLDTPLIC